MPIAKKMPLLEDTLAVTEVLAPAGDNFLKEAPDLFSNLGANVWVAQTLCESRLNH